MLFSMGKKLVEGSLILMTDFFSYFLSLILALIVLICTVVDIKHSEELWNLLCKDLKGSGGKKKEDYAL